MREYIKDFMVYCKTKEEVELFIETTNIEKSKFKVLLKDMNELKGDIDTVAFKMSEYTNGNSIRDIYLSTISGNDKYYL